jgi:phosphatidylglycerol:prolipoprotein diacylglycerol transferase
VPVNINPVLFEFGRFSIRWYGVLVAAALLISMLVTEHFAKKTGQDPDKVADLFVPLILAIIIGARLAHVATNWSYYQSNPGDIIRIDKGGLASHGAYILAILVGIPLSRKKGLDTWALTDAIAPSLAIGHIFVRLGNFINGELYGAPTNLPWGIVFPGTFTPHHPLQIYEIITSAILLGLIIAFFDRRKFKGQVFLLSLVYISVIRFLLDILRPEFRVTSFLALGQIASIVTAGGALLLLIILTRKYKSSQGKEDNHV